MICTHMNVTIIALDDINVIEIIIVKVIARWTGTCVELFIHIYSTILIIMGMLLTKLTLKFRC